MSEPQTMVFNSDPSNYEWWEWLGHGGALAAIASAIFQLLPAVGTVIATFLAMIWYMIQIAESKKFAEWRQRRALRHIAKVQAQAVRVASALEAELLVAGARRTADETVKSAAIASKERLRAAVAAAEAVLAAARAEAAEVVETDRAAAAKLVVDQKQDQPPPPSLPEGL